MHGRSRSARTILSPMASTNGAADTLARSLAVEFAPVRVNAISPGKLHPGPQVT